MEQLRARLTLSEQDAEQELGMIARLAADLGQPAPEARGRAEVFRAQGCSTATVGAWSSSLRTASGSHFRVNAVLSVSSS